MLATNGYATQHPAKPLEPFAFQRRELQPEDVLIEVLYCGVCHSDIHQARDEWGGALFPMVPGHEIIGKVTRVGNAVKRFKVGDLAGVGCFVDSCGACASCHGGVQQYCDQLVLTYNSTERDGKTPTYGGYSSQIVVHQNYTLHIPDKLPLERAAPLLCAGITTYSPLKHFNVGKGQQVAIAGLGGLGHMGVKLANAMGAEVTVLSTSPNKAKDAEKLGAHHFAATSDEKTFQQLAGRFDLLLNTIAAPHNVENYLGLVKANGALVMVGAPAQPFSVHAFSLIRGGKNLKGSMIGGLAETQEMLDYCAKHNVASDVEVIPIQYINTAYDRLVKGDVRYRFVIDMQSLKL